MTASLMTEELFRADAYLTTCQAKVIALVDTGIQLDRTVFYPTGGGQPGDTGSLITADGRVISIVDTQKGETGIVHVPAEGSPSLNIGDEVTARIDWERRYRHMRMHTPLHLLCAVVEGGVTGGQVGESKSRLDFDIPGDKPDKETLTARLNELVQGNHGVQPRWVSDEELAANPNLVRTMSVKPPTGQGRVRLLDIEGVDLQPCGGTHVRATGEIGQLLVSKIESKGKQNRRIVVSLMDP
ncbi:alanyl-tRNA editing protein [Thermostichus vulcanus]|uniref:Alanyl-tRNA editing protein n=1 Tax=Thermostichus vulcanus str. 'Rupite' TaxID=2813851 RepID=A0ABT0CAT4_THEVL|nr:alanyl-tRNA editing protein [Thermostichus vulcanus]MCJ2542897.1 alanyl-tRNA editing protein [Thermostichus vulcanus str. 'Rupite']